jgi:hypothetical protein
MILEKLSNILLHENSEPVEFVIKSNYLLSEDNEYIPSGGASAPRFSLGNVEGFQNVPINKPITPSEDLIIKAIKYGMIFLITYKGVKDNHTVGHERVIYPMVFGRSSVGKLLIRGYHLKGWSVSNNRNIEKIWRLFRYDRIKSIIFTGSFYRLPPTGYNMYDKGMRGGIIARADFNEIRRNQETLLKAEEIQSRKDIQLQPEVKAQPIKIKVINTNTEIDLDNPYENQYLKNEQNAANLRITFLKSIYGDNYIAVLGTEGERGNQVSIENVGQFKVLQTITGKDLKKVAEDPDIVKGNKIFKLYTFMRKV